MKIPALLALALTALTANSALAVDITGKDQNLNITSLDQVQAYLDANQSGSCPTLEVVTGAFQRLDSYSDYLNRQYWSMRTSDDKRKIVRTVDRANTARFILKLVAERCGL